MTNDSPAMFHSLFDLRGRTALVTGSSRGIGREIALALAEQGANIVVHAVNQASEARSLVQRIQTLEVQSTCILADLANDTQVRTLAEQATAWLGRIDILVLNASVQTKQPWHETSLEDFDRQVNINLRSSMRLMQLLIPSMTKNQWGRVLTIGSVQQDRPHPEMLVYAASKCGLMSFVLNLSKQVASSGVTINNLAPGVIETQRNEESLANKDYRQKVLDAIPAASLGNCRDCIGAALLLCSEAGRYITGVNLPVDGGLHLR